MVASQVARSRSTYVQGHNSSHHQRVTKIRPSYVTGQTYIIAQESSALRVTVVPTTVPDRISPLNAEQRAYWRWAQQQNKSKETAEQQSVIPYPLCQNALKGFQLHCGRETADSQCTTQEDRARWRGGELNHAQSFQGQ